MNPKALGFIYKQFCQSIFTYGLEFCNLYNYKIKEYDTRQAVLIKLNLGLSKYCRTSPLLEAMGIDKIHKLCYKFKLLFHKQIGNNLLCKSIMYQLSKEYGNNVQIRNSFVCEIKKIEALSGIKISDNMFDNIMDIISLNIGLN